MNRPFYIVNRFVEQIQFVCKILPQTYFVVEGHKSGFVFAEARNGVDEIFRRFF